VPKLRRVCAADAKTCRFCQHSFVEEEAAERARLEAERAAARARERAEYEARQAAESAKPWLRRNWGLLCTAILVIAFFLGGTWYDRHGYRHPASPQQGPPSPQPQQQSPTKQIAQLPTPAKSHSADRSRKYANPMSAGSPINESTGDSSGHDGTGGDSGLGNSKHGHQVSNVEILSDTMGVDFGPYFKRVLHDVRENWYNAIPEPAQMKHGNLIIEFAITKDGKVAGMKLVAPSGDIPLDRAAWAGIAASDPFPPLPSDFGGQHLALRFRFHYNPTKEEAE
jgi:TonB family protein